MPRIETRDERGNPNGYVITVWNQREQPEIAPPAQVYVTAIAPGCVKGPHLHRSRRGLFCCIRGNARIVTRDPEGAYQVRFSGEDYEHALIEVPPGTAAALHNDGDAEAVLINMPTPAWAKDDQDEWPVEGWVEQPTLAQVGALVAATRKMLDECDGVFHHAESCYCGTCRDEYGNQHPVIHSGVMRIGGKQ